MRPVLFFFIFLFMVTVACAEEHCRDFEGFIEPSEQIALSSQVSGVVEKVLVERGDAVKKGQVVAILHSGVENAAVALGKAQVAFGQRKIERNEEMIKEQLISVHERDELATEVLMAKLELRKARERLRLRTILSPIDGLVVERVLGPGEYINEGAIIHIAAIDPLNIEVVVPVECIGAITDLSKSVVRPEAPVGGVYPAKIAIVDKVIDAASGTFGVRLNLPNPKGELPAGIKCRVEFSE